MDFWRTVEVLFRRWYITVPAFLTTLNLAAAAYSVVPVQYESGAVLVLTTPLTGGTEEIEQKYPNAVTNPLMNFDRSLSYTAAIVIQQMNSSETAAALGLTPGGATSYEVTNGSTNPELLESGPFLFITGTASTPEEAREMTEKVAARATAVLDERQTELDAPASTHIGVEAVVAPTAGQLLSGNPMRAVAAALGLGAAATLTAVYGFESRMSHRRRRRLEKERALQPPPDDTPPMPPSAEVTAESIGVRLCQPRGPDTPASSRPAQAVPHTSANPGFSVPTRGASGSALGVLESAATSDAADAIKDEAIVEGRRRRLRLRSGESAPARSERAADGR